MAKESQSNEIIQKFVRPVNGIIIRKYNPTAINNKKNTSLYKFGKKEISFIIKKISENEFYIWPSVCPHEGASLEDASFCDTSVKCPWHGLSFNAVKLSLKNKSISKYGFIYKLDKDCIKIFNDNSKN